MNAHYVVWGTSDNNGRDKSLLDFIVSSQLLICNTGNESTFLNKVRKEVIGITLCSFSASRLIYGWHLSDEPTLSDHRHILFRIYRLVLPEVFFRNLRMTD